MPDYHCCAVYSNVYVYILFFVEMFNAMLTHRYIRKCKYNHILVKEAHMHKLRKQTRTYLICFYCNYPIRASAWVVVERHTHCRTRRRYPFLFRLWVNLEDMSVDRKHCSLPTNLKQKYSHCGTRHMKMHILR